MRRWRSRGGGPETPRFPGRHALACLMLAALLAFYAADGARASDIPPSALRHRAELIRVSRAVWGLDAPVAVFAAQVHTESWWRNDTVSSAGAEGLAQFLPSTAAWLPQAVPELEKETGPAAPFNPGWALRALVSYDKWLWERLKGDGGCQRMAFTLSAYNGGLGWVRRDQTLAVRRGYGADRWFGQVEEVNAGRRPAAFRENRRYVRLILLERQKWYRKAGWGPGLPCGGAR